LHLSSKKAMQAALQMAQVFPHIDFRREVTIGHLVLDTTSKAGVLAKVNPRFARASDVEFSGRWCSTARSTGW
jgi:allantoinase